MTVQTDYTQATKDGLPFDASRDITVTRHASSERHPTRQWFTTNIRWGNNLAKQSDVKVRGFLLLDLDIPKHSVIHRAKVDVKSSVTKSVDGADLRFGLLEPDGFWNTLGFPKRNFQRTGDAGSKSPDSAYFNWHIRCNTSTGSPGNIDTGIIATANRDIDIRRTLADYDLGIHLTNTLASPATIDVSQIELGRTGTQSGKQVWMSSWTTDANGLPHINTGISEKRDFDDIVAMPVTSLFDFQWAGGVSPTLAVDEVFVLRLEGDWVDAGTGTLVCSGTSNQVLPDLFRKSIMYGFSRAIGGLDPGFGFHERNYFSGQDMPTPAVGQTDALDNLGVLVGDHWTLSGETPNPFTKDTTYVYGDSGFSPAVDILLDQAQPDSSGGLGGLIQEWVDDTRYRVPMITALVFEDADTPSNQLFDVYNARATGESGPMLTVEYTPHRSASRRHRGRRCRR